MASAVTLTTIDAMMKELYADRTPEDVAMRNKPLLQWFPRTGNAQGDLIIVPLTHAHGQGRSAQFANAQTNVSGGQHARWAMTRASDYATMTIDAETMRASMSDFGAFVRARKREVDGMLEQLGGSAAKALYGDGFGILGERGSLSVDTVTLSDSSTARNFELGMTVRALSNDKTTSRAGSTTVAAVDIDAGTVTLTSAAALVGFVDTDVLYQDGDVDVSGTPAGLKMLGLESWLPLTAPTVGDSHHGVDRSVNVTRLAGHRLDQTANSIEENLMTLCEKIAASGGRPDTCFMNYENFSEFVKTLSAQVMRDPTDGKTGIPGITVACSSGMIKVIPDSFCPGNRAYVLQKDSWTLYHLDGLPHIVEDDGLRALRQSSDDGIEIRARYWAQPACYAPSWNGVFAI